MVKTGRLINGVFVADDALRSSRKERAWKALDEINSWRGDLLSQHEALVEFVEKELKRATTEAPQDGGA